MKIDGIIEELKRLIFRRAGKTIEVSPGSQTINTVINIPDQNAATTNLVTDTVAQTLTNKTLTSPVLDTQVTGTALEGDLSVSASASKVPTAAATKTYTDAVGTNLTTHAGLTTAHGSTSANTAGAIVQRDGSGNFSAGTITANLSGNATSATSAGSVTGTVATANGGTGVSGTATFPTTGVVVTETATQTLTGKTLSAGSNTITGLTKNDVGLNNVDNTSDATKNAASATLTNKTLDAPAITSMMDLTDGAPIRFKEQAVNGNNLVTLSAPPSLAADYALVLPNAQASANQFLKNDGTGYLSWSSAGGGSGRNYLSDYYEGTVPVGTIVNGLTATGNRAANQTSFGASSTSLLTIAANATNPLRQTSDYRLTHVGVGAAFIETPMFNLDQADLSKAVIVSFDLTGNVADGDYDCVVMRYNSSGTYQETISVAGNASSGTPASAKLPTGTTSFKGFFVASSTATDFYSVRIRRLSGSATSNVQIDSIFVGPQSLGTGYAAQESQPYTPGLSAGWGTTSGLSAQYSREGEFLVGRGSFTMGTVAASLGTIALPSNLNINSAKMTLSNNSSNPGNNVGLIQQQSAGAARTASLVTAPLTSTGFVYLAGLVTSGNNLTPTNVATIFDSSSLVSFYFRVPIAEWTSNVTMADRQVEEYLATDSFITPQVYRGINGSIIPSSTPAGTYEEVIVSTASTPFSTSWLPGDSIVFEYDQFGDGRWVSTGTNIDVCSFVNVAGTYYGIGIYNGGTSASPSWRIIRGKYRNQNSQTWGSISPNARFRFRKVSGGASVGYPVSARNIVGDTSGTAVPAGSVGQEILFSQTTLTNTGPSTAFGNVLTINSSNLPNGVWLITGVIYVNSMGAGGYGGVYGSISDFSGNTITDHLFPTITSFPDSGNSAGGTTFTLPPSTLNMGSSTVKYVKVRVDFSSGQPQYRYWIKATRIA